MTNFKSQTAECGHRKIKPTADMKTLDRYKNIC